MTVGKNGLIMHKELHHKNSKYWGRKKILNNCLNVRPKKWKKIIFWGVGGPNQPKKKKQLETYGSEANKLKSKTQLDWHLSTNKLVKHGRPLIACSDGDK